MLTDESVHTSTHGRPVTLHSQPETQQDQWVLRVLNGKENGTFLEVGAFDGVYHSNTLCLERHFGWTGWLIESVHQYAQQARNKRWSPVVNLTVGPVDHMLPYYVGGQWSGLKDYTRPNLVHGHIEHDNPVRMVRTVPLQTILSGLRVPEVIDYLSIDVEGAEFPILESYFRDPPSLFRCMTIETGIYGDDISKLCNLLEPQGYYLEHVQSWESYWIHKELCT